jgi:hypothetical protein
MLSGLGLRSSSLLAEKVTCLTDRLVYNAPRYTTIFLQVLSAKKNRAALCWDKISKFTP